MPETLEELQAVSRVRFYNMIDSLAKELQNTHGNVIRKDYDHGDEQFDGPDIYTHLFRVGRFGRLGLIGSRNKKKKIIAAVQREHYNNLPYLNVSIHDKRAKDVVVSTVSSYWRRQGIYDVRFKDEFK